MGSERVWNEGPWLSRPGAFSMHNSQFTIHNSRFTIQDARCTIHDAQFMRNNLWWGYG